jgi:hypothetical protein
VNWLGLWTLYKKEVRRFLKVSFQTILAPVATSLLFMLVFTLAIGSRRGDMMGVEFASFLAPGLVMLGILNNAFANSSSSLIVAKVQGNTVPPRGLLPQFYRRGRIGYPPFRRNPVTYGSRLYSFWPSGFPVCNKGLSV